MIQFLYKSDYSDNRGAAITSSAEWAGGSSVSSPSGNPPSHNAYRNPTPPSQSTSYSSFNAKPNSTPFGGTSTPFGTLPASVANPMQPEALLMNAKVYVIAEKYDVGALKTLATKKYKEVLPRTWNSPSFIASLALLYDETPDTDCLLREVALNAAGEHAKDLVDRGEFAGLCRERGEIAFDVLKASLGPAPNPNLTVFQEIPLCKVNSSHKVVPVVNNSRQFRASTTSMTIKT
jgi:hypothetical protein